MTKYQQIRQTIERLNETIKNSAAGLQEALYSTSTHLLLMDLARHPELMNPETRLHVAHVSDGLRTKHFSPEVKEGLTYLVGVLD